MLSSTVKQKDTRAISDEELQTPNVNKVREISSSYDASIKIPSEDIDLFTNQINKEKKLTRISSIFLYNLYFDRHYLYDIKNTDNRTDVNQEFRQLIKNIIDSDQKKEPVTSDKKKTNKSKRDSICNSQSVRDIINVFNPHKRKSSPRKGKTEYKNPFLTKAYDIKERTKFNFDLKEIDEDFISGSSFDISNRLYLDAGIAHTISHISNLKNWVKSNPEKKNQRENFLKNNQDYAFLRTRLHEIEDEITKNGPNYFPGKLHEGHLKDPKISPYLNGVTEEILSKHREFNKRFKLHKKPRFNPTPRNVSYNNYKLFNKEQYHENGPTKYEIKFSIPGFDNSKSYPVWIRPHIDKNVEICGIQFGEIDIKGFLTCRFRLKIKYNWLSFDKNKIDINKTLFVDISWKKPCSYAWAKGNKYIINTPVIKSEVWTYLNEYDDLRRKKQKIPDNLKQKMANTKDTSLKQFVANLCSLIEKTKSEAICFELSNNVYRSFYSPKNGRKSERRTNYLLSAISFKKLFNMLSYKAKQLGFFVVPFTFKSEDGKKNYRPSQTCVKCNSLGKRFFIEPKFVMHKCGDRLVCVNGHITHADATVPEKLARRFHKDPKKRLKMFDKNEKMSYTQEKECEGFAKKYFELKSKKHCSKTAPAVLSVLTGKLTCSLVGTNTDSNAS